MRSVSACNSNFTVVNHGRVNAYPGMFGPEQGNGQVSAAAAQDLIGRRRLQTVLGGSL